MQSMRFLALSQLILLVIEDVRFVLLVRCHYSLLLVVQGLQIIVVALAWLTRQQNLTSSRFDVTALSTR